MHINLRRNDFKCFFIRCSRLYLALTFNTRSSTVELLPFTNTILKSTIGSPYYLFALPPFFWLYWKIQRIFVSTTRQLKRIESVSKSPIYAHFGESINGATTIRAYDHKGNWMNRLLRYNNYVIMT